MSTTAWHCAPTLLAFPTREFCRSPLISQHRTLSAARGPVPPQPARAREVDFPVVECAHAGKCSDTGDCKLLILHQGWRANLIHMNWSVGNPVGVVLQPSGRRRYASNRCAANARPKPLLAHEP